MFSLRIPFGFLFLVCLALCVAGCGDDDGAGSGGGSGTTGGGGNGANPDASGALDALGGLKDGGGTPGLADGGGPGDGGGANPGDGGGGNPDGGGAAPLCGNGHLDGSEICDPGLDACCKGTCDGPIAKGHVCRDAAGKCDEPEACDGRKVACPADALVDEGTVCRREAGDCDVAEKCDGEHPACPDDALIDEGEECRPQDGKCDVAEECDGEHADCPDDALADEGTECRAKDGQCDVAEECDGADADCPSDEYKPLGSVCRGTTSLCDAEETCDGITADCPSDEPAESSVVCRPGADSCDAAESCTGSSKICPADLPDHCAVGVLSGTLPITVTGSTAGACADYDPSCPASGDSGNANEYVYVFTAMTAGTYRFDTLGSAYDTIMMVLDGTSCGASELGCNDDGVGSGTRSVLELTMTAGQNVLVVVDGYQSASGAFTLTVRDADEYDGWTCSLGRFGDGSCECGCGVVDVDCEDDSSGSCEYCMCGETEQPCNGSPRIDADDNSQCSGWHCPNAWYGAEDGCDCGCGARDPDCDRSGSGVCELCGACGDGSVGCGGSASVTADDNSQCEATWTCMDTYYADGHCDCGCGVLDPDCAGLTSAACEFCDACGDTTHPCASSAAIDPNNNTRCAPVTAAWTCNPNWYDSGLADDCDCGCGIVDPDCGSANSSECDYCFACRDSDNPCPSSPRIVAADNSRCQ